MAPALDANPLDAHSRAMRFLFIVPLLWLAVPAQAETGCEDVWFTRNLIMDRAGYCFDSALGQALFDNSDCIGKQVQPDPYYRPVINEILRLEVEHACRIDTNRQWLDMDDINFRRVLTDFPVRDEFEGGCLGWTGPQTPLYDGHHEPFRAIGQVGPGDYVHFAHYAVQGAGEAGWRYVTVHAPVWGPFKSAGWMYWPGEEPCADYAG
ncbi:DUF4453 domain-containing protein [Sedimentitalea todarodis]|uniref:DUF4453 domain-containing protein n=2 Tax=Sedimentitalea todarodis TaxID=1631240 RepID=A0ABU3VAK7_9RHOB|nr:DUF4453 domain-containing protein [Sedimentitalea todarodis]